VDQTPWETRDLPVLRAIVELCEELGNSPGVNVHQIADRAGLREGEVNHSLALLHRSDPRYIVSFNGGYLFGPTERAYRELGLWPSADILVDRLLSALEQIAANGTTLDERSAARKVLDALPSIGRDILIGAITNQVPSIFH
jgi:hypothetical protein